MLAQARAIGPNPAVRGWPEAGAVVLALPHADEKPADQTRRVNNPRPERPNLASGRPVRDTATTTLSGNPTRKVELRSLPSGDDVGRLRVATGTRRRPDHDGVKQTNHFTAEAYGPQAQPCVKRLGTGSLVRDQRQLDWPG